jgi:uncharacterized protein (TIGR00369 family)
MGELHPFVASMPFAASLGIDVVAATPERVEGRLQWSAEGCTTAGVLHGGVLMSFGDTLGAICAFLNLPAGASTSTIESKTNFFRAVRDRYVVGTTRPLHVGKRFIVVQTDIVDANGQRVAQVTQTQAVLGAS